MDTPTIQTNARVSIRKPLIIFALPFIMVLPTFWFFHNYIPEHSAAPPQFGGVEHMRVHWGVFWIITFFPFAAICFLSSVVMLVRRARHSADAKIALIPVGLFALGVLAFVAYIVFDIVRQ